MQLLTSGQIAEKVGVNRDVAAYALRRTGVEPVGRAGIIRLFDPKAVEMVRTYIAGTRSRRRERRKCRK